MHKNNGGTYREIQINSFLNWDKKTYNITQKYNVQLLHDHLGPKNDLWI